MAAEFVFLLAIVLLSVVIHEVSHGFVAEWLGDPTARLAGRLTLNPIPHLSLFGMVILPLITWWAWGIPVGAAKPVPYNPHNLRNQKWGPAMVAAAGPISNLIVAFTLGLIIRSITTFVADPSVQLLSFVNVLSNVVMINVILAVINFVPIPPIDGSKIIFPFLPIPVRQNLIIWSRQMRPLFARYWLLFLLILFIFGGQLLFFIFAVISPIIDWLFVLMVGIPPRF